MASRKWFRNHSPFLLSGYTHCIFLLFFMFSIIKLCPRPKPTTWKLDHIIFFSTGGALSLSSSPKEWVHHTFRNPNFSGCIRGTLNPPPLKLTPSRCFCPSTIFPVSWVIFSSFHLFILNPRDPLILLKSPSFKTCNYLQKFLSNSCSEIVIHLTYAIDSFAL